MDEQSGPLELGRWLARGREGAVRLRWASGELTLRVCDRRVVGVEGMDRECLARALEAEVGSAVDADDLDDDNDLLARARDIGRRGDVSETRVLAAVKTCLEPALREWLVDPQARVDTFEGEVEPPEGAAISLPHVLVETVLADDDPSMVRAVLPRRDLLLRRAEGFLERYASLQLAEEAALVVAKVTGQRTAEQIVTRSPQSPAEVERLLAALVVAGLIETVPVVRPVADAPLIGEPATSESEPRVVPWRWIGVALGGVIVIVALLALLVGHGEGRRTVARGRWGIAVDMGCEAVHYERMLRKADRHGDAVRAVQVEDPGEGSDDGTPCWRLIWGEYGSEEEAAGALSSVPDALIAEGFEPHVVPLTSEPGSPDGTP